MIKAVMIDVDGVLVEGRPSDGRHWATSLEADLGLRFELLQDVFFKRYWDLIVTGRTALREQLAAILSNIAPALTADEVLSYWFRQDARLNQELVNDLAMIRAAGSPVYLATNQEHERARDIMNVLGLAAHVDGCYYSAAVGHRKPSAEFFAFVAADAGLAAPELLLIDDDEDNIKGARKSGWHAAQWTGQERIYDLVAKARAACPDGAGPPTRF